MELKDFPFIPLLLTLFLFLLMLMKIISKSKTPNARPPPGPRKLPIVGSMHHLIGGLPHCVLRDLARKHGPVMHLKLGQVDVVVISSPEAAEVVTKTRDASFASRPELMAAKIVWYESTDIAFAPYNAYWRQMRKICALELLSANRVKSYRSLREEEASNTVASISAATGSPLDLSEMFLTSSNTTTARAAFGKGCKQQQRFIPAAMKSIQLVSGFNLADLFPSLTFIDTLSGVRSQLNRLCTQIDEILDEIIEYHQVKMAARKAGQYESDEENLVDVLLRIKDHGGLEIPLTMDNIKAVILDMFAAGTETSSTTLEWAMSELMRNPKVMEKAQGEIRSVLKGKAKLEEKDTSEMHYLKLVIKETLRLHPPLPLLLPRVCGETCEIDGFTIQAGSRVVINMWSLARDPGIWVDAESFKPERFSGSSVDFKGNSFEYLPFGAGRRICPGMGFGLANVEFTLAQLLFHFNWELPGGLKPEELDMDETFGTTARRKNNLCLIATPNPNEPSPAV